MQTRDETSVGWWSFSSGFSSYFSLVSVLTAFLLLGVARAIFVCRVAEIAFRSAISAKTCSLHMPLRVRSWSLVRFWSPLVLETCSSYVSGKSSFDPPPGCCAWVRSLWQVSRQAYLWQLTSLWRRERHLMAEWWSLYQSTGQRQLSRAELSIPYNDTASQPAVMSARQSRLATN